MSRIEATQDLRQLDLLAGSQSEQGYKSVQEKLAGELGSIVVDKPKFDRAGLQSLKGLGQGGGG